MPPDGGRTNAFDHSSGLHDWLRRLRSEGPVTWVPEFGGWVVTTHDLCVSVLRDATVFTVDTENFSTRQVVGPSMLSLDGREHRRHRLAFAPPFRARAVHDHLSDWVFAETESIVSAIGPGGSGDLRALLAAPLSARVMSKTLGLENVSLEDLSAWNNVITAAIDEVTLGGSVPQSGQDAFRSLRDAVSRTMDAGTGPLGRIRDEGSLTVDEAAANVAVLLIGGVVTSEGAIGTCFRHLLTHHESLERVREEPDRVNRAIDESMRLEPAAAFVDRYATRDTRVGGVLVKAGDLVRVSISAANRDPEVFEDPDVFDIDRSNSSEHIAFAQGPHACLGIHLARLETKAAITTALRRLGNLRADGKQPEPEGLIFRAPPRVPAVWTRNSSTHS